MIKQPRELQRQIARMNQDDPCPFGAIHAALHRIIQNGGWNPIESAPKDGTEILLHMKTGTLYVGSWRLPTLGEPQNQSHYKYEWRDASGRWATPTHWMPLPEPPNAEFTGGPQSGTSGATLG